MSKIITFYSISVEKGLFSCFSLWPCSSSISYNFIIL